MSIYFVHIKSRHIAQTENCGSQVFNAQITLYTKENIFILYYQDDFRKWCKPNIAIPGWLIKENKDKGLCYV